jgi:hypothetical protein
MRPLILAILVPLAACGGDSLPTPAELHGDWSAEADGQSRGFHFAAADDGTHPELADMTDIYVLHSEPTGEAPIVVQTGIFAIDRVPLTELDGAEDDALVTTVLSGNGAGSIYGNRIVEFTGDTFTISGTSSSTGQLTFTRD